MPQNAAATTTNNMRKMSKTARFQRGLEKMAARRGFAGNSAAFGTLSMKRGSRTAKVKAIYGGKTIGRVRVGADGK